MTEYRPSPGKTSRAGERFAAARRVLDAAVRDRAFPGCAAAVGSAARELWTSCHGHLSYEARTAVGPQTLYDLASLTKIVATTATTMVLDREGLFDPGTAVQRHLPYFRGEYKERVRLEHLQTHCSGLPAWKPFYQTYRGRDDIVHAVARTPLERPPQTRTVYSDLGAILWGACLEEITGLGLAPIASDRVFQPLGMRDTMYCPPASERSRCAPTEFDAIYRKRLVQGEVHDENAHAMGGVSGHAGLFSTIEDMARFGREIVRGLRGESPVFPREIVELYTRRRHLVPGSTRALGWDTRSERGSSSGSFFSRGSFGHTGFTGTSIWIDPVRQIYAVLLSNRVHPTRANRKITAVRRAFHDAVIAGARRERF